MIPVQFPPGVTNLASKNAEVANWRESHLIRWDDGTTLRPVGGWAKYTIPPFTDKVRKMHRWSDNNNTVYTAYLCESHCYVEIDGIVTDITPAGGMIVPVGNNGGYSDDKYSKGKYNTPRSGESRLRLYTPTYSIDNWGQDLRVMTSADGRLLGWSPTAPASKLVPVTNAPIGNRSFIITPERHIMLFGMNAFDVFGWCDEEDDTNWAFTDIFSRAGYYNVSPKSPIVAHQLFDGGIIMFTPAMSYHVSYSGLPYVYVYRPIGQIPIPMSAASICDTPLGVMWFSIDGVWLYDGTNARAIPCAIWDFIFEKTDVPSSRFHAACVHMINKGEVWWFFASLDIPLNSENGRYACYDYRSKIWNMGKLSRSCGFVYANDRYPVMSDGTNVWKHEIGFSYPDVTEMPWIESFNLTPNGGENWITLNKILPDVKGDPDALRWSVYKTNDRNGYKPEVRSPLRKKNEFGWVDIRETARDMRLRIEMVKESDWSTIGPILFDSKVRGKK
jgi:hypothetical protein